MQQLQFRQGQASVEYLLVLPLTLVLIVAILEFVQLYRARMTLDHAVQMTVRAGALNHGCESAMRMQLARSLTPLMEGLETSVINHEQRQLQSLRNVAAYAYIKTLHPTKAIYDSFRDRFILSPAQIKPCGEKGGLNAYGNNLVLENSGLSYRPPKGGRNQQAPNGTVQDANILKIRVLYCHKLTVPLLENLLGIVQSWSLNAEEELFYRQCLRGGGGHIPLKRIRERVWVLSSEAVFRMQTPLLRDQLDL